MRSFYEEWSPIINRQPMADKFNWSDFVAIGFSHHIEIITKAKSLDARLFYIHESATRFWNKYTLRDYLKADLYNHRGTLPNNFTATMPSTKQAFFNRELNSLVVVELKSGKFRSSYLGQLSTYLSALDKYVKKPHENPVIGILLCRDMNQSFVEFAIRDYDKPMGVATYRATKDMPERLRNALPDIEELKKLL